jgi:hypothetical protein
MGETRLWHGGAHLRAERGADVVAPFAGKIVAARLQPEEDWPPVGSPNFVLVRHDLSVAGADVRFFTLLLHLDDEGDARRRPPWLRGADAKKWGADLQRGEVVTMEEPIGAGEVVGHFGEAGKPGAWQGQVHFEVFSEEELGSKLDPGFWKTIDGAGMGRFCAAPEIVAPIDANRSGTLARSEIVAFFRRSAAREAFHRMAVRHVSEWGDRNDWEASLDRAKDFAALPRAAKHRLFVEQIQSMLWWSDGLDVAGLPDDKIVWTYHPITFVGWMHDKLAGPAQRSKALGGEASFAGRRPPPEIKDDGDATEGFVDEEDTLSGDAAKKLGLEDLSNGYPD